MPVSGSSFVVESSALDFEKVGVFFLVLLCVSPSNDEGHAKDASRRDKNPFDRSAV